SSAPIFGAPRFQKRNTNATNKIAANNHFCIVIPQYFPLLPPPPGSCVPSSPAPAANTKRAATPQSAPHLPPTSFSCPLRPLRLTPLGFPRVSALDFAWASCPEFSSFFQQVKTPAT